MNTQNIISVPADVPHGHHHTYIENMRLVTRGTGRLFLFAGDQKVEHMNDDYYGKGISTQSADPMHMFRIASDSRVGAFASQLGLIARYGPDFPRIPYIVKLNSKTNLVPVEQAEPLSQAWIDVSQVVRFKKDSNLEIVGVGYTVYLGSEHEAKMLREAAQIVFEAHQHGLLSVIWAYPRGKAVKNEKDPHIIAGAAGVVATLGADFAKVNVPHIEGKESHYLLKEVVNAAGRTKVICAGGTQAEVKTFIQNVFDQIHFGGTSGCAIGRNVYQKDYEDAVKFCYAVSAIVYEGKTVDEAWSIYKTNHA